MSNVIYPIKSDSGFEITREHFVHESPRFVLRYRGHMVSHFATLELAKENAIEWNKVKEQGAAIKAREITKAKLARLQSL